MIESDPLHTSLVLAEDGNVFEERKFVEAIVSNHVTAFAEAFALAKTSYNDDGDLVCSATAGAAAGEPVEPASAPVAADAATASATVPI